MSETGSDFDATDATDSPFECLTDADGNGNNGHKAKRHVDIIAAAASQISDRFTISGPNESQGSVHLHPTPLPLASDMISPQASHPKPIDSESVGKTAAAPASDSREASNQPLDTASAEATQPPSQSEEGDGLLGWISSGSGSFLSRVAEKAKNSVDSVITTLDPGMKEYLYTGGTVSIVVASDKECKVSPIREAFIDVFGRATVKGISASPAAVVATQPVGTEAAHVAAAERIAFIRTHLTNDVPQNQVIVALENFLIEMSPGSWYDMGCLYLDDPLTGLKLVTYTQTTPVPVEAINYLRFETRSDYAFRQTGFCKTIGHFMTEKLNIPHDAWHEAVVGIPRRSIVYMAACALARIFKDRLAR